MKKLLLIIAQEVSTERTRIFAKKAFLAVFLESEVDDMLGIIVFKPR